MSFLAIVASLRMPPKSKTQCLSAEKASTAREGKKKERINEAALEELPIVPTLIMSAEATAASTSAAHAEDPTETDCFDATFDPEQDASSQSVLTQFVEDWVLTLDRENTISLAPFLTYNLTSLLNFSYTKKMACHNSFDVELLYITKTPNCRCLSTKTPAVTTKTPVVTTKTPLGNN